MTPLPGGTLANRTGQRLEDFASQIIETADYWFVNKLRFFPMRELGQPIYSRQVQAGKDLYEKERNIDIFLYHPVLWPDCLAIQCKWQSSSGTVDEKYPFEVLSVEKEAYDTIILLDGGGYSPGAKKWLTAQAGSQRLKHVFSLGEFQRFASQGKL